MPAIAVLIIFEFIYTIATEDFKDLSIFMDSNCNINA